MTGCARRWSLKGDGHPSESGGRDEPRPAGDAAPPRVARSDASARRLAGAALDEVRDTYAWPRVARLIADAYARVAGTPPDTAWEDPGPPEPCRFRAEPHLL